VLVEPLDGRTELVALAKTTSFTTWVDELARRHTHGLAAAASREGLNAEFALDAVQEAFLTFLALPEARALAENHDESFALFVGIVRNAGRNLRRRHHLARPHLALEEAPLADEGPTVDELIARAEEHVAVLDCVQQLAEVQRHVVTLRMVDEMSGAETAAMLGLTPGYVAVALHRAKSELRRCLAV
jgi:RNA polymerase sigma-70 factor (ECF subfamily)